MKKSELQTNGNYKFMNGLYSGKYFFSQLNKLMFYVLVLLNTFSAIIFFSYFGTVFSNNPPLFMLSIFMVRALFYCMAIIIISYGIFLFLKYLIEMIEIKKEKQIIKAILNTKLSEVKNGIKRQI